MTRHLAKTIAHKAINLTSELSGTDKRVAGALVDHFNLKNGRCDPSIGRIAKLLGLSDRSVIRAIKKLVACGMFKKALHGGFSGRNSYEPKWQRFQAIDAEWTVKFRKKAHEVATQDVSLSTCQNRQIGPDQPVTQTLSTNSLNQSSQDRRSKENGVSRSLPQPVSDWRNREGQPSAYRVQPAPPRRDVVRMQAHQRWHSDFHERFKSDVDRYAAVMEALDTDLLEAATEAELKSPGTGLRHILEQLQARGLTVTGPSSTPTPAVAQQPGTPLVASGKT